MKPRPHQIEIAKDALAILKKNMLVYLACEERTGKTLSAILLAEAVNRDNILVITKKKAIDGWVETLEQFEHKKEYTVTNYHKVCKLSPQQWGLIIIDEAHSYISSFPKTTKMWQQVRRVTTGAPVVYLSATPAAQGYHLLYHQLALSDWSPWRKYIDAYDWFRDYGIPDSIWVPSAGRSVPVYKKVQPRAYEDVKHLFVTKTRKELNFEQEPEDVLHYIDLKDVTKKVYNTIMKAKAVKLNGKDLICDTGMRLRSVLHMIEGGVTLFRTPDGIDKKGKPKFNKDYTVLGNTEKIDYIKKTWGDSSDVVVMYHYIAEGAKLEEAFENAKVLQATSNAEGVDLSMHKHLIIYSQDFSTARYTQRRARQANMDRKYPIKVHYLLVKDAISEQVYNTVAINKQNYVDKYYQAKEL